MGTPRRISISLPVQHRPTTLIPVAPKERASSTSSGSWAAATTTSESIGLCPCMAMLTWSVRSTPRLTSDMTGFGVPNMTSESSVAIIEPPQPSDSPVRRPWSSVFT